jgi:Uma2 family endonuclease
MSVIEPIIRRWTRDEYYRMGDAGLFEGQRVELIDGEIVQMAPQKDLHAVIIGLASRAARAAFGASVWVREQLPLRIGEYSEPEPDVSVVSGDPRDYIGSDHPATALLVIEVSDTTLRFDQQRKASLYASAGIGEYWIINVKTRQLEVYRNPASEPSAPFAHIYGDVVTLSAGASISPLGAPSASIAVSDLLP